MIEDFAKKNFANYYLSFVVVDINYFHQCQQLLSVVAYYGFEKTLQINCDAAFSSYYNFVCVHFLNDIFY